MVRHARGRRMMDVQPCDRALCVHASRIAAIQAGATNSGRAATSCVFFPPSQRAVRYSWRMPNRLAAETSPYLRQHAGNPVEWWPWSDAALAEARATNKPILLSIGYSACHWCHVMAHESFEDDATARVMNKLFVNIKVDREERPDIDQIYMSALHLLGEQGGWPLTMFLTAKGEPVWGGTYWPKE